MGTEIHRNTSYEPLTTNAINNKKCCNVGRKFCAIFV